MKEPLFEEISEEERVINFLNKLRSDPEEPDEDDAKELVDLLDDGRDAEGLFFSKALVIVSLVLYFLIVTVVLSMAVQCIDLAKEGVNANLSGVSAALAAMISVPIALPCTCIVWYLKKTQTGYTAKVQGSVYTQVADKEVECKKELMKTQHDLKLSDMEANKANIPRVDGITSGAFNALDTNMKTAMTDATAQIKKEGA